MHVLITEWVFMGGPMQLKGGCKKEERQKKTGTASNTKGGYTRLDKKIREKSRKEGNSNLQAYKPQKKKRAWCSLGRPEHSSPPQREAG